MLLARLLPLCLLSGISFAETSGKRSAPSYSLASLVNSATQAAGFAPNTLATLYGLDLAFITRAMAPDDIRGDQLPTILAGSGVRILVNSVPTVVYYVCPTQVNFLIPSNLLLGPATVQLTLEGRAGPILRIMISETAPGLFPLDRETVIATHADGSLVNSEQPARPSEVVVLYANGLGATNPSLLAGILPRGIALIRKLADLRVTLNGEAVPAENILYAGITPGMAGLYQINLRLPESFSADPEIKIQIGEQVSPAGMRLLVRPE